MSPVDDESILLPHTSTITLSRMTIMFDKSYLSDIEERVYRDAAELKDAGAKIVGTFCVFTPKELIAAAGAVPVSLCSGTDRPIAAAEQHLPRNLCPLVKSSYGHALLDTCPYFHETDFVLADATCDGKKKMFELLNEIRPIHLMQLPQTAATEESFRYWLGELHRLKSLLEEATGNLVTDEALNRQIRIYNGLRDTLRQVHELNLGEVPLLYGREVTFITDLAGFECSLDKRVAEMRAAMDQVVERKKDARFMEEMKRKPRILITGCPTKNKKVLNAVEEAGGVVVAMENCGGLKPLVFSAREDIDPMEALARRYLSIPCSCMTPNPGRFKLLQQLIENYRVAGVVDLTWQACHTYNVEAFQIQRFVNETCGKAYLQIETDYSENDAERIRVRVEAFLELMN